MASGIPNNLCSTTAPWSGVSCKGGNVTAIDFSSSTSSASGALTGCIPTTFGYLHSLVYLSLAGNSFGGKGSSGALPTSIGYLTALTYLSISGNQFNSIPDTIGQMTNLVRISMNTNNIIGTIPTSIGNLNKLASMDPSANGFTGSIPSGMFSFPLSFLDLHQNCLVGSIPSPTGSLLTTLTYLDLTTNSLTGTLPISLGQCSNLVTLNVQGNSLRGTIPTAFNWRSMQYLSFEANRFTGPIPSVLSNLVSVGYLDLGFNCLQGTIPSSLAKLSSMTTLYIVSNSLTGSIPSQFCPPFSCHGRLDIEVAYLNPGVTCYPACLTSASCSGITGDFTISMKKC